MDLPMPGSPPTSTAEDRAIPPPKTRSSSLIPVDMRGGGGSALSSGANSTVLVLCFDPEAGAASPPGGAAMFSSTSAFHALHASQRPDHLAWAVPQDWQTKAVVGLAMCGVWQVGRFKTSPQLHLSRVHEKS